MAFNHPFSLHFCYSAANSFFSVHIPNTLRVINNLNTHTSMPLFCIFIYRQQFVSLPYHKRLISLQVWYPSLCAVESWYACIWLKLVVKQSVTDYKVQNKTAQFKENLSHPRILFPAEKFNLEVKKEDCIGNIQVLLLISLSKIHCFKRRWGIEVFLVFFDPNRNFRKYKYYMPSGKIRHPFGVVWGSSQNKISEKEKSLLCVPST